jgi:hypothetical protein
MLDILHENDTNESSNAVKRHKITAEIHGIPRDRISGTRQARINLLALALYTDNRRNKDVKVSRFNDYRRR